VLASSSHKAAAEKFVSFLASAQAEKILAAGRHLRVPDKARDRTQLRADPVVAGQPGGVSVVGLGDDLPAASLLQQAGPDLI